MKRSFGISIKRSKNYQSVEVSDGIEGEFESEAQFNKIKDKIIEEANKRALDELNKLDEVVI